MKISKSLITFFLITFLSSPSWSEIQSLSDLVKRNETYYKKFSNIPFDGTIKKTSKINVWYTDKYIIELTLTTFIDGKVTKEKTFHDDFLFTESNFKDGKLHGTQKSFFHFFAKSKENTEVTITYNYGILDGLNEQYYENGNLKFVGHYKANKKNGPWKVYHSNGMLWSIGHYKNGKKIHLWKTFHENGVINTLKSYSNSGIKSGLWKFYDAQEKLSKTQVWESGELIKVIK